MTEQYEEFEDEDEFEDEQSEADTDDEESVVEGVTHDPESDTGTYLPELGEPETEGPYAEANIEQAEAAAEVQEVKDEVYDPPEPERKYEANLISEHTVEVAVTENGVRRVIAHESV